MTEPNLHYRISKAFLEASHYRAGREVLSESSRQLLEGVNHLDKRAKLLLWASSTLNAPTMAKRAIVQDLHTYLLLYDLAYEDLSPQAEMRIWTILQTMASREKKLIRELASMLADLEKVNSGRSARPREPERKPWTEEQLRILDRLIDMSKRRKSELRKSEETADGSTGTPDPSRS